MATILLTWELGGGRGHLGPLRQLAKRLFARGHRVILASRDVAAAGDFFAGLPVEVFAAPLLSATPAYAVPATRSFADILHNVGFGSQRHLRALCEAWLSIYRAVRPDAIVFDHSPTALAASFGIDTRRIVLGTGFACPPLGREGDDLRVWLGDRREQRTSHTVVLDNLNMVRQLQRLPALDCVGQLFALADATLLATFAELDHFGPRAAGRYVGVYPFPTGALPQWPDGAPRAFAYLKPHKLLDSVVAELTRQRIATILYTGSEDAQVAKRHSTDYVRVATGLLDLRRVMAEADFAILNGSHATTAAALLAGKPTLQFPLALEQWVFANRVREMGAGALVGANQVASLPQLVRSIASGEYSAAARGFAANHAGFDPQRAVEATVETIESTVGG
jgi:UDP:flavonoid glycosyltransferase YjiC (YdhE family)